MGERRHSNVISLPKIMTYLLSGNMRVQSTHSTSRGQTLNLFAMLASHEVLGSHHSGYLYGGLETATSHLKEEVLPETKLDSLNIEIGGAIHKEIEEAAAANPQLGLGQDEGQVPLVSISVLPC